ncbi:hypothetical protein PGTUg99_022446 [Puccinia graminis f. sp. tritici]|uniref:Uncharacterized protein n=1 Tax=Puccinia graminis f. sp. tritici TaxID=56615 RepID=A0A5B0RPI5_PUCGR|nr:hypothetical protein PGTUg99_022446 [Puccinia graminis f. sp. tritici]
MDSKKNMSEEKKHWPQGDLVIERFQSLTNKYQSPRNEDSSPRGRAMQEDSTIDHVNMKKDLLTKLRSNLLPELGRQITDLVSPLDPTCLKEDPGLQLEIILAVQSELEGTLSQIQSAILTLCSEPLTSESIRNNDQHRKELKSFRATGLHYRITEELLPDVMYIFDESEELILQMKLSAKRDPQQPNIAYTRSQIIEYESFSLEGIRSSILWLEGSEFDLVQYHWPKETRGIDKQLEALLNLINGTAHLKEGSRMFGPLSDPAVRLSKSLLPIIKLSRLFLDKLSNRGMNRKRLPLHTEMRSDQLATLYELAGRVGCEISDVLRVLRTVDRPGDHFVRPACTPITTALEGHFESALLLIPLYFLPLVPDTDGFPIQTHFKAWFVTWYTQFSLAIQNFIDAAGLFDDGAL